MFFVICRGVDDFVLVGEESSQPALPAEYSSVDILITVRYGPLTNIYLEPIKYSTLKAYVRIMQTKRNEGDLGCLKCSGAASLVTL